MDNPFSTRAKCFKKLTFLTPGYVNVPVGKEILDFPKTLRTS